MDYPQILGKLTEIERAIGVLDSLSIRRMVAELQDYILDSQRQSVETRLSGDSQPAPFSLERRAG